VQPPFILERVKRRMDAFRFYDTFDWRLYRSGHTLRRTGDRLELRRLDDDALVASAVMPNERRFWWEYPDGPFRGAIRELIGVRALTSLMTVRTSRSAANIIDEAGKAVARASIERVIVPNGRPESVEIRLGVLRPIRGYCKEFRAIRKGISRRALSGEKRPWFELVMEAGGVKPGDYTSRLELPLRAEMSAREAAVTVCECLAGTLRCNEDGLRKDIDTEFLHDFRVAVRRTRSALTQFKDVFSEVVVQKYKDDFMWLGRLTGRLRDLDVYLLRRSSYAAMLPPRLRPFLLPMFEVIARERMTEHERLVAAMGGPEYSRILSEWRAFLSRAGASSDGAPNAGLPIGPLAKGWIRKRHGRVIRRGRAIDDSSPDADLHQLRIEVKKLRYLLEFFAALFPPAKLNPLVKQLKKFQDHLGDFHDLSVQREELNRQLEVHDFSPDTDEAIRALTAMLGRLQGAVRSTFGGAYEDFSSKRYGRAYRELFS
jgi:CHAD domain-containing protein